MEAERFEQFTCLISGIYRDIQKIKSKEIVNMGLKNVHVFWMYLLRSHPDGLSASQLAQKGLVTRALVSREITHLTEKGFITAVSTGEGAGEKRRYGWKFILTEQGRRVADDISKIAYAVQNQVDHGISEEELQIFYKTLTTLFRNFEEIVEKEAVYE